MPNLLMALSLDSMIAQRTIWSAMSSRGMNAGTSVLLINTPPDVLAAAHVTGAVVACLAARCARLHRRETAADTKGSRVLGFAEAHGVADGARSVCCKHRCMVLVRDHMSAWLTGVSY